MTKGQRLFLQVGSQQADDVVRGDDSRQLLVVIHHRQSRQVVLVEQFRNLFFLGAAVGRDQRLQRQRKHGGFRSGQHDLGQGHGPGQSTVRVHQVNGAHGFDPALKVTQGFYAIAHRGAHVYRQVLGVHSAGGGIFLELQELYHLLAFLGLHFQKNFRSAFFGQIGQQVGGRVRFHLLHDVSRPFRIERLEDGLLDLGLNFLQGTGCNIVGEGFKDRFTFVGSQIFDDVGDVGGMELGQAVVGDFQLYPPGRIRLDEVNKLPRDAARRDLPQQRPQRHQRNHALQQSPDRAARTDVNRAHFQDRAVGHQFLKQIEVVHPDDLPSEYVDDLLIEKIASQQQHALGALALGPVGGGAIGANTAIDRGHGWERQQAVAGAGLNNQYSHPGPVFLRNQRHLAHPSAAASGSVKHRSAQQFGKRKGQHASENTQVAGKNLHELFVEPASRPARSAGNAR